MKDTRGAINQAELNDFGANVMFGEIFLISVMAGVLKGSWAVGGAVFLGLIAITWFKKTLIAFLITLTFAWPIIFWIAATNSGAGFGTKLVFSIIIFLFAAGVHMSAFEWTEDMDRE